MRPEDDDPNQDAGLDVCFVVVHEVSLQLVELFAEVRQRSDRVDQHSDSQTDREEH